MINSAVRGGIKQQGLDGSTLIIVSAKHGQSPIDPKDRVIQSDKPFQKIPGFGTTALRSATMRG